MTSLTPEAWAALLGALVGAIAGGVVTWLIQLDSRRRDETLRKAVQLEGRQARAQAVLYKLIAIASHYATFTRHIEDAFEAAAAEKLEAEPWTFVLATAGDPDPIHFTDEEMTLLVTLKMDRVFNSLLTLGEAHNQMIILFGLYARKREELLRSLPNPVFHAEPAAHAMLPPEQVAAARPLMIEANGLIKAMREFAARDAKESLEIFDEAAAQFKSHLDLTLSFGIKNDLVEA